MEENRLQVVDFSFSHLLSCSLAIISSRLFGVDDGPSEGTESEGSGVKGPVQPLPSYAATAALPASGPITPTLTG